MLSDKEIKDKIIEAKKLNPHVLTESIIIQETLDQLEKMLKE